MSEAEKIKILLVIIMAIHILIFIGLVWLILVSRGISSRAETGHRTGNKIYSDWKGGEEKKGDSIGQIGQRSCRSYAITSLLHSIDGQALHKRKTNYENKGEPQRSKLLVFSCWLLAKSERR